MTILWRIFNWLSFLLQPAMVTLAIVIAARRKTVGWILLAAACVCHFCLYNTRFLTASAFRLTHGDRATVPAVPSWAYHTALILNTLFLLLIIGAFIAFIRERSSDATRVI